MNFKVVLAVSISLLFFVFFKQKEGTDAEKVEYYKVFQQDDLKLIDKELQTLSTSMLPEKEAFIGAMLMKKAGLVSSPRDKLSLFKKGHAKLESAIMNQDKNAEYRFLRLVIQENAPAILGYKNDIGKDKELILSLYKTLSVTVRDAIHGYTTRSKILHSEDFN